MNNGIATPSGGHRQGGKSLNYLVGITNHNQRWWVKFLNRMNNGVATPSGGHQQGSKSRPSGRIAPFGSINDTDIQPITL